MNNKKCPYEDKDCPKIQQIELTARENSKDIKTLYKFLYVIIGMIAVNTGLIIW